jgi:hypothetical protein
MPEECYICGHRPKNPRDLVGDSWNDFKWRCNNLSACAKRKARHEAKAEVR